MREEKSEAILGNVLPGPHGRFRAEFKESDFRLRLIHLLWSPDTEQGTQC